MQHKWSSALQQSFGAGLDCNLKTEMVSEFSKSDSAHPCLTTVISETISLIKLFWAILRAFLIYFSVQNLSDFLFTT